jgi:hypothetical protein
MVYYSPGNTKALSWLGKGLDVLKLVAGRDLNPRPLGYEPYDARLWCLGQSLVGVVTSADRTDPVSLRRFRLPCLVLSRRVRFTNRFTEQAIDLRSRTPSRPSRAASLGLCRVRARQATSPPVMPHAEPRRPCRHHPLPGFALGHRPRRCPAQAPPRTRLLPDLTATPLLHASRRQREPERRQPGTPIRCVMICRSTPLHEIDLVWLCLQTPRGQLPGGARGEQHAVGEDALGEVVPTRGQGPKDVPSGSVD